MSGPLLVLTTLAVAAVFIVLLFGFWTMSRGNNPEASQRLMRWRVGLQFAAIVILLLALLLSR